MASAWLIRRFVDPRRTLRLRGRSRGSLPPTACRSTCSAWSSAITASGCTFETLCDAFRHRTIRPSRASPQIVHDLDLKDGRFGALEARRDRQPSSTACSWRTPTTTTLLDAGDRAVRRAVSRASRNRYGSRVRAGRPRGDAASSERRASASRREQALSADVARHRALALPQHTVEATAVASAARSLRSCARPDSSPTAATRSAARRCFRCSRAILAPSPPLIGFVVGASTLTGIVVKLPAGALSDVLGRRPLLVAGALVFALMPFTYLGRRRSAR